MPDWIYRLAADGVLAVHVGIVAFVVLGLPVTLIGGWLGWGWVRRPLFRVTHLALIAIVAGQAVAGVVCPLTIWESELRTAGGQRSYEDLSFVAYWLREFLFYEAPPWVFTVAYVAFGALVAASFWWVPVRRRQRSAPHQRSSGQDSSDRRVLASRLQ